MKTTADTLLLLLKSRGESTAASLARTLRVSPQAVREQLTRLRSDGLVSYRDESHGVGRPRRQWRLTDRAQARFPDTHAELTVELIDAVREELGEEALERLVRHRERRTLDLYRKRLRHCRTTAEKVAVLVEQRSDEGYMAVSEKVADGWLLIERHCPICAAARTCRGFCRAELEIFRSVLGDGCAVERSEHLLAGDRRCAYLVRPSPGPAQG
jgi:predicted ArsR family transcriptional regulator